MMRVGQRVVFIGPGECSLQRLVQPDIICPIRNHVYTIRELTDLSDVPGLRLVEIRNRPAHWFEGCLEVCWKREEFRPLVEKKTDISIFTGMLRKHELCE